MPPTSNRGPAESSAIRRRSASDVVVPSARRSSGEYRVGPGKPPKEHQFKKGQSGNPLGARLRKRSIVPDLKLMLQRALNEKMPNTKGEKILTKAAAGIRELVDQFACGDKTARRDLIQIAEKLGVDLTPGDALADSVAVAMTRNDQELIDDFIEDYLAEREAFKRHTS